MTPVPDPHPLKISWKFTLTVKKSFNKLTLANMGMD